MTNPGLDNRLRQHSRRAGFIIGISMLLTIAVCIGGFAFIYAKVDPLTSDFVNRATLTPTSPPTKTPKPSKLTNNAATTTVPTSTDQSASSGAQPTDTPVSSANSATQTPSFTANYRVSSDVRVNLRSGPSVNTDIVNTLDSGTELQYLNKVQDSANPVADGATRWLQFRTANGDVGWVREIDVAKIG